MALDTVITGVYLRAVADAIRAKTGASPTDLIMLEDMATAVAAIPTGGDNPLAYAKTLNNLFYNSPISGTQTITLDAPYATGADNLFRGCTALRNLTIHGDMSSVTSMQYAFLVSATITIDADISSCTDFTQAFAGNINTSFKLPACTPVSVGAMFYNCIYMKLLDLSDVDTTNLTTMKSSGGARMLAGTSALRVIKFGNNCSKLPGNSSTTTNDAAFRSESYSGAVVIDRATPPTLTPGPLFLRGTPTIYVPDASVNDYKAETNWAYWASNIYPMSEYEESQWLS